MSDLIQWTNGAKYWNSAFNPVVGCVPVSEGCENCYASRVCRQYDINGDGQFTPTIKPNATPAKKGIVFVGNMTDIFGEWNSEKQIDNWITQMSATGKAEYLLLTKRTKRMRELLPCCAHPFVNIGMTAENQERYLERINDFRRVSHRGYSWLSAEPLLSHIDMKFACNIPFQWVVVGAESGPNRRPCKIEWVESIVEQCQNLNIPVFVKQIEIGGVLIKDISQFPIHLQIRQIPWEARS